MNLANTLNLTNLEMGLILIEISLLATFFLLMHSIRRPSRTASDPASSHPVPLREWVRESEALCDDLNRNLEEKKRIAERLVSQLDEKIRALQAVLGKMDQGGSVALQEGGKKELDLQISEMARAGYDVSEIARQLQCTKGEVQLTLDLKRYRQ
jgi:hypothetical protein